MKEAPVVDGRHPEEPLARDMGIDGDTFGEIRVTGLNAPSTILCAQL